ncbi:branched-chain amino acid aminotransferase [Sphingosinicella sp. GR2756]|uniref:Branched-chain-amino-acid aminotransferase n=2 Tax=Sphingosinicella rhizophila TaxID=3050082 RepID=A0ABU3Q5X3_9SPHN|nr:branched-chain amino acid aminotransferase [Sphingosinicella sp. GR2756]MDT9598474.1 branched-chain amino acid aminotransferase [Sphingosinicella sp. GR2756]
MEETAKAAKQQFNVRPNAQAISAAERATLLEDPGFGRVFTDHMVVIKYSDDRGWYDAEVTARAPLSIDPACSVLHYAQEIFEGMKAYRTQDGGAVLFRPDANARRFRQSAERLAMPLIPEELFLEAVRQIVSIDRDWVPSGEGALYLRPFMFGSEVMLGVRPSSEYLFLVIASPAGNYFKGGKDAVTIWVSNDYTRAAPGGTGAAKCGGNYAAGLLPQAQAVANGCDQVVFLDAVERRWVDELGGMNLFFVFDDGSINTPPLGTILPGITRDSLLTIARDRGIKVSESPYAIDQWRADAESGRLRETFACGTAAVITPVGEVRSVDGNFKIGDGGAGPVAKELRKTLTDIQRGNAPDPHGWVQKAY